VFLRNKKEKNQGSLFFNIKDIFSSDYQMSLLFAKNVNLAKGIQISNVRGHLRKKTLFIL